MFLALSSFHFLGLPNNEWLLLIPWSQLTLSSPPLMVLPSAGLSAVHLQSVSSQ